MKNGKNVLAGLKNFSYSRTLFTNDDGSPMMFYAPDSDGCTDLSDIICNGGGILTDTKTEGTINLCNKNEKELIQEGFLPLSYIKKCVLRAVVIDPDDFRRRVLGVTSTAQTSNSREDEDDDDFDSVAATSFIQVPATSKGRRKYTDKDDFNLLAYIVNHRAYKKVKGNALWNEMVAKQVTGHTGQSMRSRFHKTILPNLDLYQIPADWKDKLTGKFKRAWEEEDDEDEGSNESKSSVQIEDNNRIADTSTGKNLGMNGKTDIKSKRNKIQSNNLVVMEDVKKNVSIKCFRTGDSLSIRKYSDRDKDIVFSTVPSNDASQEQAPLYKKTEENRNEVIESLGFRFEEDEDEFQSAVEDEELETKVRRCNKPESSSDKDCNNKNTELLTDQRPTNPDHQESQSDKEEFQSFSDVEEAQVTLESNETVNYRKGLESDTAMKTESNHADENIYELHYDSSSDGKSFTFSPVGETVMTRDDDGRFEKMSNSPTDSSARHRKQRQLVKNDGRDDVTVSNDHDAGDLIEVEDDEIKEQTKHSSRYPIEAEVCIEQEIEELTSSDDGGEIEECVSKDVTRQRIKAVMEHYNLDMKEAIDFMEENQDILWPIVE